MDRFTAQQDVIQQEHQRVRCARVARQEPRHTDRLRTLGDYLIASRTVSVAMAASLDDGVMSDRDVRRRQRYQIKSAVDELKLAGLISGWEVLFITLRLIPFLRRLFFGSDK